MEAEDDRNLRIAVAVDTEEAEVSVDRLRHKLEALHLVGRHPGMTTSTLFEILTFVCAFLSYVAGMAGDWRFTLVVFTGLLVAWAVRGFFCLPRWFEDGTLKRAKGQKGTGECEQ